MPPITPTPAHKGHERSRDQPDVPGGRSVLQIVGHRREKLGAITLADRASVKFSHYMRNHGINNCPDQDSSGHIPGVRHFGGDPNSAQFPAAVNACKHSMRGIPGWL
jgi:hypothetical protein